MTESTDIKILTYRGREIQYWRSGIVGSHSPLGRAVTTTVIRPLRLRSNRPKDLFVPRCPALPRQRDGALLPRAIGVTSCLLDFEQHKARLDLTDDSGYWLIVASDDSAPFVSAFRASAGAPQDFIIEQRMNKHIRILRLKAQVVKIAEGPAQTKSADSPCGNV